MPLPRFWYLPRGEKAVVVHERRRPLAGQAPGGTASNFDRFKALSPAGCVVAEWECVRSTLVHLSRQPAHERAGGGLRRRGLRGRRSTRSSARARRDARSAAQLAAIFDTQLSAFAARSTRASRRRSRAAPTASTGPTGRRTRRSSSRTGSGWTRTTTTTPAGWIGAKPGFMNGGGFPMRFADLDGTPIDVYQQNTNMTDEAGADLPVHDRRAARQRRRPERLLRRVRREHAHRQPGAARRRRGDRRRGAGARRAGDLVQAAARLGRRPQQLDDPRPELERRHAHVHDRPSAPARTGCRRCCRCRARPGR